MPCLPPTPQQAPDRNASSTSATKEVGTDHLANKIKTLEARRRILEDKARDTDEDFYEQLSILEFRLDSARIDISQAEYAADHNISLSHGIPIPESKALCCKTRTEIIKQRDLRNKRRKVAENIDLQLTEELKEAYAQLIAKETEEAYARLPRTEGSLTLPQDVARTITQIAQLVKPPLDLKKPR